MCFRPDSGQNVFQSTPPRGRRRLLWLLEFSRAYISIHASAREATLWRAWLLLRMEYFNPLLREGGDFMAGMVITANGIFQSTPPRGRRLSCAAANSAMQFYFNPRLREGGDTGKTPEEIRGFISIHASAREATALITNFYI